MEARAAEVSVTHVDSHGVLWHADACVEAIGLHNLQEVKEPTANFDFSLSRRYALLTDKHLPTAFPSPGRHAPAQTADTKLGGCLSCSNSLMFPSQRQFHWFESNRSCRGNHKSCLLLLDRVGQSPWHLSSSDSLHASFRAP